MCDTMSETERDSSQTGGGNVLERPWPWLRWVSLGLDKRCFFRCRMCDMGRVPPPQPEKPVLVAEWRAFLRALAGLDPRGARVDLSCGEPFFRIAGEVLELAEAAEGWGLRCATTTNGWLIDEAMAERICASGLSTLSISIDALDPLLHDRLRGMPGSHERAMRALDLLLARPDRPHNLHVLALIMEANLEEIPRLVRWVQGRDPGLRIAFQVVTEPFGRGPDPAWREQPRNRGLWPRDPDRVAELLEQLLEWQTAGYRIVNQPQQLRLFQRYFRDPDRFVKRFTCRVGESSLFVDEAGDCRLCGRLPPIGNIREQTLMDLWVASERTLAVRAEMARCAVNCHALLNCAFTGEDAEEVGSGLEPVIQVRVARLTGERGAGGRVLLPRGGRVTAELSLRCLGALEGAFLRARIRAADGRLVCANNTVRTRQRLDLPPGESRLQLELPDPGLAPGFYELEIEISPFENRAPDPRCVAAPPLPFRAVAPPDAPPGGREFPFRVGVQPAS
jgi:MoaA/NifB/PqqE/SkfB family radical SAM enzyme